MKKLTKRQSGISLIEVMVTMFLVMLGLVVVMGSFVANAKSNRFGTRVDVANSIVKLEMERMRNMRFADIVSEEGDYGEYSSYPDYRHVTTVIDQGTIKQIDVTVYFENDRRSETVTTYVSNL